MEKRTWLKGNTHTHTSYSDGDSPPEVVADWYADHGYAFIFLTDHNTLIPEEHLRRVQRSDLAVWQGEEITMAAVHMNGLGLQHLISPPPPYSWEDEAQAETSPAERVGWAIQQVTAQGGVASVNHPTTWHALAVHDLLQAGPVPLLEVANMHPDSQAPNAGLADYLGTEPLWDGLLSAGQRIWGVASDDAHHFTRWGAHWANPGRGWVMVEAHSPDYEACLGALHEGRFYASTGLDLASYEVRPCELALELASGPATIELVGASGRVLQAKSNAEEVLFALDWSHSSYVRVRARDEAGKMLWTQPQLRPS